MPSTVTRSKFSERQQGGNVAVNVQAASPQLRRFEVVLTTSAAMVVQNTSKYLQFTSCTTSGIKVISAYVTFAVAPAQAGGTSTLSVRRCATDGTTFTDIVTAASVLSGYTAFIPVAQTIAAANPSAITIGQSIVVTVTASNDTVGTADSGISVTLLCEHVEDTIINDTDMSTAVA